MPCFTRAKMNQHVENSGKQVANAKHHSIPTNLKKAKTFLKDEYLKAIKANSDQRYFYLKAIAITVSGKVELHVIFVFPCTLSQVNSYMPTVHAKLAKWDIVTTFVL